MLAVNGLEAWYGESHILHGVTFEVQPGEVVTLLGRNGVGKTTTLKAIMGIVEQRSGSVRFEGRELIGMPSDAIARAGIAFCPEERGIFASLDVRENLLLPPQVRPGGLDLDRIFALFPNLRERLQQSGHQTLRRRAADAGDRPHSAHRRPACCCSTSRPKGWRRSSSSKSARPSVSLKAQGFTVLAGRAEFPLRRHGGRPALRHGTRPHRRRILDPRTKGQYGKAARLSRSLI